MFVTVDNLTTKIKEPVTKINIYREQLLRYLDDYQINLNDNANIISEKANSKAKIVIASNYDSSNVELCNDAKRILSECGSKTHILIYKYMRSIMLILGKICECIIIDNCKHNPILNMKCINYACFKNDIDEDYKDINYNAYTPFSPSHGRIVLYSDSGIVRYKKNIYTYEPNHINKDIIWCGKESLEDILKTKIPNTKYYSDARLQVKASTNYGNIVWNEKKYRFSPIIYFDLSRDVGKLYDYIYHKNINLYVKSVLEFGMELMEECSWYFRLLAGHFSGLINIRDKVDVNSLGTLDKAMIRYIVSSDIKALISDRSVLKSDELLNGLQKTILYENQDNVVRIELVE